MTRLRATLLLLLCATLFPAALRAGQEPEILVDSHGTNSDVSLDLGSNTAFGTNGILIKYGDAVLVADSAMVNRNTGEAVASGRVRLQQGDQVWVGEHIRYNFKTRQMISEQEFRTGKPPVFAGGRGLHGDITNHVYYATNAMLTADDISHPAIKIRAQRIRIIPGERIEARHAVLYLGGVPVFYFPYYSRNLSPRANNFNFTPGWSSRFGPFLLGNYTWFISDQLDAVLHLDYRDKRGVGGGPDVNFHLGRWGEGTLRYYYTQDHDPETNATLNAPLLENRQRVHFSWQAEPFTNLTVKSLVRYQNDIGVLHDFFQSEYRHDPQPDSYVEVNKFWRNFSLDAVVQPRLNDFYETVARLPDVRLTGFRQQLGPTPVYYETESTAGYYQRLFAETNGAPPGLNFYAARADTFHQLTIPKTFFGWLNFTPRAGGRFTYYDKATGPGAATDEIHRGAFNTGAELSFKASRLWAGAHSSALELDGLRHILEPSVNYVYVPRPNHQPDELPQFDYELPSLPMLPITFPEYNSLDSIDSQNVIRFGLGNKLQTKRKGKVEDFLNWEVFTDWRLEQLTNQTEFSDIYSSLTLRPRSWLTLQSQTRFDIEDHRWNLLLNTVTFRPNDTWSWSVGNFYLRDDLSGLPTALGQGNNIVNSTFLFRLNENWGFRAIHHYDVDGGRMQEQDYTIYRDLRSWTVALTGGVRNNEGGPEDYTVAFSFSLKAMPRGGVGSDSGLPYSLMGR